jgi:heme/copper-type cytochrome/quinol oxidase subunit 4
MRLRRLTLPVGFGLLGILTVMPLWLLDSSIVLVTLGPASVSAIVGPVIWMHATGPTPSRRRGATTGALVVLANVVVVGVLWILISLVTDDPTAGESVSKLLSDTLLFCMFLLLSASVAALPAMLFGAAVAPRPEYHASVDEVLPSRLQSNSDPDSTYRRMRLFVGFVVVGCLLIAGIQYTDPTSPTVGDAPAYGGADAPAETQIAQAQARTNSISYTVSGHIVRYSMNGSIEEIIPGRFVYDRSHDRVKKVRPAPDTAGNRTTLYTEDGVWRWDGDDPSPADIRPVDPHRTFSGSLELGTDSQPEVVETTPNTVRIRFPKARDQYHESTNFSQNQTVIINRSTGRVVKTINRRSTYDDDGLVVTTLRYHHYGNTTVTVPKLPGRPLEWHIFDLINGPVNGETPMLEPVSTPPEAG